MTPELWHEVETQGACIDLSDRAKFRLIGADRVRYLNGQVTNDVRKATSSSALHACVTNAKGRIEADIFIHASQADGESLWVDADASVREALLTRLDRYIVADEVELTDVTEDWRLWHVFGKAAETVRGQADTGGVLMATRFGVPGADVWFPATAPAPGFAAEVPVLTASEAEVVRVIRGIPRWPEELNGETFPQEAGLEATTMDFTKGCYIGQEVLSRIKTTGRMPRRLIHFSMERQGAESAGPDVLKVRSPDWRLCIPDGGALKTIGSVSSAAWHPALDRITGLGYVRQGFEENDSLLLACEDPPRILGNVKIFCHELE